MADTRAATLRRLWLNVHLWLGVGLASLLIPISVSGALDAKPGVQLSPAE